MKVLKNNSLINLQQGIELVVQALQRSNLGKTCVLLLKRQFIVFTWTNKQVKHVFLTFS